MQKRRSATRHFLSLWLAASLELACGGAAAGNSTEPSLRPMAEDRPDSVSPPARLSDAGWERLRIDAALLELELPDAKAWSRSDARVWTRFEHAHTGSVLEVQGVRAGRLVRPVDCEARARLDKPELPRLGDSEDALDRRTLAVPPGFTTEVRVNVSEGREAGLDAHVLGFGAKVGRCLALHFATSARGPGQEAEIARRLGLIVERVMPSLSEISIEARVQPEPFRD